MILSRDRILTTHVGSLPRNDALNELLVQREAGEAYDKALFDAEMEKAVRHVVAKQKEAGIDIGNDGEQQRVGFQTYVPQRMSGFGGESKRRRGSEFEEFPELVELSHAPLSEASQAAERAAGAGARSTITILGRSSDEIARFKRIAGEGKPFAEEFMTAPSPGIIASTMLNAFYDSTKPISTRIAREMRNEYQAIHEAGLDAADRRARSRDGTHDDVSRPLDADFLKTCELHVHAINKASRASRAIACGCMSATAIGKARTSTTSRSRRSCRRSTRPRSVRCRSSSPIRAMRMNTLRSRSGRCPKDMILIPGVMESTSNFVEHPEVVARRIEEAVAVVGDRERVDRLDRLRLRHLRRPRMGDRAGGVAEAEVAPGRRRYRLGAGYGGKQSAA